MWKTRDEIQDTDTGSNLPNHNQPIVFLIKKSKQFWTGVLYMLGLSCVELAIIQAEAQNASLKSKTECVSIGTWAEFMIVSMY